MTATATATLAEKFVVKVKALGEHWREGDVVTGQQLCDAKASIDRLLTKGAIRYATRHEQDEKKVTFKSADRPTVNHDIKDLTEQITYLKNRIAELEGELAIKNKQLSDVKQIEPSQSLVQAMREKDALIEQLTRQVQTMQNVGQPAAVNPIPWGTPPAAAAG